MELRWYGVRIDEKGKHTVVRKSPAWVEMRESVQMRSGMSIAYWG